MLIPCPLKEAARDAPRGLAILSKGLSLTFSQLDHLVDSSTTPSFAPLQQITQILSAWRRGQSAFPINPQIPHLSANVEGPPQTLLIRTSGSTGAPKIAILSLANLLANAADAIGPLDLKEGDRWRLSLPLYHVGGIGIMLRCLLARATMVLDDDPDITHLSYVPTHLYRATPIYKKLRCLLLGGAPIHSYPRHLPVYTTYGLTEMGSMVTLNGSVLAGREVKLSSEGEIHVRGACLFQGYWGEPKQEGWFATGDLGRWTEKGLTILGRKDWMFISGGENIQPEEIERQLLALPQVVEAVVLPRQDPEFGHRPIAIVQTSKPLSLEAMQEALSPHLPKYKIPIQLHCVEEIPKKNSMKPDRFILMQMFKNK